MILIKPLTPKLFEAIYPIECECFSTPWSQESLRQEITQNDCAVYVAAMFYEAFCTPYPVGYGGLWHIVDEGHINKIAVTSRHRRKGVADAILTHLSQVAQSRGISALTLEVRVGNTAAQSLYAKHGFTIEGLRKGYYADTGEDAYIMWKSLSLL